MEGVFQMKGLRSELWMSVVSVEERKSSLGEDVIYLMWMDVSHGAYRGFEGSNGDCFEK